jgi:hypothetical protein
MHRESLILLALLLLLLLSLFWTRSSRHSKEVTAPAKPKIPRPLRPRPPDDCSLCHTQMPLAAPTDPSPSHRPLDPSYLGHGPNLPRSPSPRRMVARLLSLHQTARVTARTTRPAHPAQRPSVPSALSLPHPGDGRRDHPPPLVGDRVSQLPSAGSAALARLAVEKERRTRDKRRKSALVCPALSPAPR